MDKNQQACFLFQFKTWRINVGKSFWSIMSKTKFQKICQRSRHSAKSWYHFRLINHQTKFCISQASSSGFCLHSKSVANCKRRASLNPCRIKNPIVLQEYPYTIRSKSLLPMVNDTKWEHSVDWYMYTKRQRITTKMRQDMQERTVCVYDQVYLWVLVFAHNSCDLSSWGWKRLVHGKASVYYGVAMF